MKSLLTLKSITLLAILVFSTGGFAQEDTSSDGQIRKKQKTKPTPMYMVPTTGNVDDYILMLSHPEKEKRIQAVRYLASFDDPNAFKALADALLDDPYPEVRVMVARAFEHLKRDDTATYLVQALSSDDDFRVRAASVDALGALRNDNYLESLYIQINREDDQFVLNACVKALDKYNVNPFARIARAVRGVDTALKHKAVKILNKIDDPRSIDLLLEMAKDPDVEVRRKVVFSLAQKAVPRLFPNLVYALKDSDKVVKIYAITGIANTKTQQAKKVLMNVASGKFDIELKERAIRYLGEHKVSEALSVLVQNLKSENNIIRHTSIMALGNLGDPRAVKYLSSFVDSSQLEDRVHAISAMAQIGGPEAIAVAVRALADKSAAVREMACYVVGKLKAKAAVDGLIKCLGDKSDRVRTSAARSLGQIGDPKAIGPLTAKLEGEISVEFQEAVRASIGRLTQIRQGRIRE